MSQLEQFELFIGRLYTHFLYRDLAYLGGGILVLAIPAASHGALDTLKDGPWWLMVPVVLAAYALGFFAQEMGVVLCMYKMFSGSQSFVDEEVKSLRSHQSIARNLGEGALLRLERIILLKHVSAVLGSSSALALLLLQFYYWLCILHMSQFTYWMVSITLIAVVLVMRVRNCRAAQVQDKLLEVWLSEAPVGQTSSGTNTSGSGGNISNATPDV